MKQTKLKKAVVLAADIPNKLRMISDKTIEKLRAEKFQVQPLNPYLYEKGYDLVKDADLLVAYKNTDFKCDDIVKEYQDAGIKVEYHGEKAAPEKAEPKSAGKETK